jgi:signal peptidase
MKIFRGIQTAILAVLCTLGTLSVVVCAVSFALDLQPSIVLSGSMEPTLPVGSVVFTQTVDASQVQVGDIVTVPQHGDDGIVTHRVVAIAPADAGRAQLTLRGDANQIDDVAPYTVRTADKYRFKIPHIGTAILWAKDHRVAAGAGLLALLAFTFIGRTKLTVRLPNGDIVKGLSKRDAERLVAAWQAEHAAAAPTAVAVDGAVEAPVGPRRAWIEPVAPGLEEALADTTDFTTEPVSTPVALAA